MVLREMCRVAIPLAPAFLSRLIQVINIPVTEALIERENATQLKKWRETRGELQYKPSRRLHGSRAIHEESHRMNPPLTASASLLSLTGLKQRVAHSSTSGLSFSPAHSAATLAVSAAPPPVPPAAQSQVVVSEGLHPALPSPTGNNVPLGGPKKASSSSSSKEERRKEKEREKQERLEKERQKQEKEREKKLQKEREKQEKEREKQEKEREKKLQKERAKEEAKLKKERKLSLRKKEPKAAPLPPSEEGKDGDATGASVLQDTYF